MDALTIGEIQKSSVDDSTVALSTRPPLLHVTITTIIEIQWFH